jgi:hypothetical protein
MKKGNRHQATADKRLINYSFFSRPVYHILLLLFRFIGSLNLLERLQSNVSGYFLA